MAKKLSDLTTQVKTLKEEIKTLKEAINNQNLTILDLLKDQKLLIAKIKEKPLKKPLCHKRFGTFPLESIQQLADLDANINDENLSDHIKLMRTRLGIAGLRKNLRTILKDELIMQVNIRGVANKVSLNTYTNFMNALYHASSTGDQWNLNVFIKELQDAIKVYKNRVYKTRGDKKTSDSHKEICKFEEITFKDDDDCDEWHK